tara:strand:+ start:791 stop:1471 length:681 start_codon:yes stop_codon:yes gene_type:complete
MTYWVGKDVDLFMTTEQALLGVSGNTTANGMSAVYSGQAWSANIGTGDYFTIPNRTAGISGAIANGSKITDVTGIDFSPSTIDENISFMGKNTNLTAEIKKAMTITITRKVSNPLFDYVYQHARDGVYTSAGADASGTVATRFIFDGLTTSNNVNFGYRLYLRFASGTTAPTDETMVIRNCCVTSHSKTLTPDGATEETIELYSYVQPEIALGDATLTDATTTSEI